MENLTLSMQLHKKRPNTTGHISKNAFLKAESRFVEKEVNSDVSDDDEDEDSCEGGSKASDEEDFMRINKIPSAELDGIINFRQKKRQEKNSQFDFDKASSSFPNRHQTSLPSNEHVQNKIKNTISKYEKKLDG